VRIATAAVTWNTPDIPEVFPPLGEGMARIPEVVAGLRNRVDRRTPRD
jgi:hypothetical protein